ncbi:conserved hypothetical protein [Rippkaea orientalis PCC 8801]|uniref:DUF3696 domain-containing protein n=1 Tax=Rippkaea orientalis (strain PCC 8801 / RF-1) TaxID=41431 RepID=B7JWA5_RIPO1|nr:DUF3696 domain-containing protein [Rippkaea orientalis]ACK66950.1 conserved hypothetical protein [Rippkaea orientalis PCC 8801]
MITYLKIENFKPFQSQEFILKPLTLLSGLNSTGKSSMIQALLLLRQSYQQKLLIDKGLSLKGNLVNIGTAKNAMFEGALKDDLMSFQIILENQETYQWSFDYDFEENVISSHAKVSQTSPIYQSSLFNQNFYYLQAERISPQVYFEISDYHVRDMRQIGTKGEYTAHFISINENEKIIDAKLSHPNVKKFVREYGEEPQKDTNLKHQIEAWMGDISPDVELNLESIRDLELMNLQYNYGDENLYRPTNVGFGVTYVLPIITAILSAKPDTLIILENPEAHLHPRGQSQIGQLIALAASCGVQIIVETHSDHILNGIRRIVKQKELNAEDVVIYYFQREKKEGKFQTKVTSPQIYQSGGIDQWPDGFFDQAEIDLMELL